MPLVTAPGLVISPAFDYEPHHPLVGWQTFVTVSNIVADDEEADYPATNLANPSSNLRWQSDNTAEQLIIVTGIDGETDYVGIARHNFGSAAIEVSVEAITAEPGAVWEEVFPGVVPGDDRPLVLRFAKDFYIGVRLRLTPVATAPRCAVLRIGALTPIKPGISPGYTPLPRAKSINVQNGRSEAGEFLGKIITGSSLGSSASFKDMDPDWYDDVLSDFIDGANDGDPFFFVWSPADHPDEVAYAWLTNTANPQISRTTGQYDLDLAMGGLAL